MLRERFLDGMSNTASTVSVVTTNGAAGRHGATISAMTSVSADMPEPTLLICINQTSATAQAIKVNSVFCVNVLRDFQYEISDCFAKRWKTEDGDKFSVGNWATDINGSPRVSDGLVAFGCTLSSWQKLGTHFIFFGAVQEVTLGASGSPLLYAHRSYGSPVGLSAKQ
jgi:flavin reductase